MFVKDMDSRMLMTALKIAAYAMALMSVIVLVITLIEQFDPLNTQELEVKKRIIRLEQIRRNSYVQEKERN